MNVPQAIMRDLIMGCVVDQLIYQGLICEEEQDEFVDAVDFRIAEATMNE